MQNDSPLIIDITSAALNRAGAEKWMREAAHEASLYGAVLGIQVHNSAQADELDEAFATQYPLSFHAPVMGEYMLNLASENSDLSWKLLDEQALLMKKYHVDKAVFHASLMTDKAIYAFGHGMSYHECMSQADRQDLLRGDDSAFIRDYTADAEYIMRRERLKNNLSRLREKYPEILWCVENDFPAHIAGVLRGSDLAYLEHPVCFDTGHMWASGKMLDLDFYDEMDKAMTSGFVRMIHLHASRYTFDMPHKDWGDGHLPLNSSTQMDIARIIRSCRKNNVKHIVLEIADAGLDDVKTVLRYYFED